MKRKIAVALIIVVVVIAALAGVKTLQIRSLIAAGKAYAPPPEAVSSAVARREEWQGLLHAIGSVTAVHGVILTPHLAGTVREIAFESGAAVKEGDLLVRLDTSSEEAQLRAVEAQADLARLNVERDRTLAKDNTVSQSQLDASEAQLKQMLANADTIRSAINKKTIRAPFSGELGIRQVNLGQYLDLGVPIVSLQSLSPAYVDFTLPQQNLAELKPGLAVRVTTDAYPGKSFEGELTAINPDLDSSTRSVKLQATFENAEQLLRPGMFVRVEVLLPVHEDVLILPATAILGAPYGDSVFVIEDKPATNQQPAGLVVRQQFVRRGQARGNFVSIESGLKEGQRVVSSGVFKLRNGMAVVENNNLKPETEESGSLQNK